MNWFQFRKEYEPPRVRAIDPWLDKTILINGKPTTLRIVRKFAVDMSEKDYRNPAEQGLAMTIVTLVDEVSWLQAQLEEARERKADEHRSS